MPIKDWLFFPHILLQLNPNNSQGEPREDKQGSNRPFLPRSMVFFIPTIKDWWNIEIRRNVKKEGK